MFETEQYVASGIVVGAIWTLPAIGISLVYALLRIPHFAFAELMTFGAYLAFGFSVGLKLPFAEAAALACGICGLAAGLADQAFFRPVRKRGLLPAMLLSLGLMLILQNLVRFCWGNGVRQFRLPLQRPYNLGGFQLTYNQLLILLVTIVTVLAVYSFLKWTKFGMQVRATANNAELARVTGIEPERVYAGLTALGGLLAGCGGVMMAAYTSLTPLMGWNSLLPLFAIALLGGLGRVGGAAMAALLMGLATELSLLVIQSSYKVGLAFVILACLLLLRPRGLIAQE